MENTGPSKNLLTRTKRTTKADRPDVARLKEIREEPKVLYSSSNSNEKTKNFCFEEVDKQHSNVKAAIADITAPTKQSQPFSPPQHAVAQGPFLNPNSSGL